MRMILAAVLSLAIASPAFAVLAFYKREFRSGDNKVCVYDRLGSEYFHTIAGYKVCPPSIDV